MSISVRYIYSACVVITTPDLKILCDPWFTDGIFDGSWYSFPRLNDPLTKIGDVDYIYISHIHPDHYDAETLKAYQEKYGKKKLLIGNFPCNYLLKKIQNDGFEVEVIEAKQIKDTVLHIFPNDTGSINDIDTALIIQYKNSSVVNMNDCVYNPDHVSKIKALVPNPDIALLAYTGASAYPQTFYPQGATLNIKAEERKNIYLERYKKMNAHLGAKVNLPFAGQYMLGGKLNDMNFSRGVADAVEVTEFDPKAIIMADGGDAEISTDTLTASRKRTVKFSMEEYKQRIDEIKNQPLAYETFTNIPEEDIPFSRLIRAAYQKALAKSEADFDYYFCIKLSDGFHVLNANSTKQEYHIEQDVSKLLPRSEIDVDYRYLYGLLTGVFHWNNAYVGSMYMTRREPDQYFKEVQDFLNFLSVI